MPRHRDLRLESTRPKSHLSQVVQVVRSVSEHALCGTGVLVIVCDAAGRVHWTGGRPPGPEKHFWTARTLDETLPWCDHDSVIMHALHAGGLFCAPSAGDAHQPTDWSIAATALRDPWTQQSLGALALTDSDPAVDSHLPALTRAIAAAVHLELASTGVHRGLSSSPPRRA